MRSSHKLSSTSIPLCRAGIPNKKLLMAVFVFVFVFVGAFNLFGCASLDSRTPLYTATITDSFIVGTQDGQNLLVLNLEVDSHTDLSMSQSVIRHSTSVTLDGVELSSGSLHPDNPFAKESPIIPSYESSLIQTTKIIPANEGTVQIAFELNSTTSPVSVRCFDVNSFDRAAIIEQTFAPE